MKNMMGIG